ncbi:MAG: CBS domain-containing protein [Gemmatimonadetes bacterium]|nr:CBS domain-containing protein [Gemmatimonadota bacterium]
MTFVMLIVAIGSAVAAAFCAFADGALLALDEDEPPATPRAAALLARREPAHRALAFGRILSVLLAGAAASTSLRAAGLSTNELAPAVIVVGIFIIVIAEVAARTAGDATGAPALERVGPFVVGIEGVLRPVVVFGRWCDAFLVEILPPAKRDDDDRDASIEQFREVVAAEAEATPAEAVMLRGVFSLGDTTVREIMVPRVDIVGVERDTLWSELADRVRSARHARLVVFDGTLDEVVGILYAKDLLPALVADDEPAEGWLSLVRPAVFIPGGKSAEDQLRDFKTSRRHIAIVADEFGGTAGLVTLEDALELIVGDIRDENDVEEPDVVRGDAHEFWLAGTVTLEELSSLTGRDFTREDVTTVGGLVYELVGQVPRAGQMLELHGCRVVVERVVRHRVERVYVALHPESHA